MKNKKPNYKYFAMFIGYPRSGHTLVGAILNAHINALVAHEYDVVNHVESGSSFEQIETGLIARNQWFQERQNQWSGYSYQIPNQHQASHQNISILGDKKGGKTTYRFLHNFSLLQKTINAIPLPIKWIHVCRNPFNIITTMTKYKDSLESNLNVFIKYHETYLKLKAEVDAANIFNLYHEDIINDSQNSISNLLSFLDLKVEQNFIDDCSSIIYKKPNNSAKNIGWPDHLVKQLNTYMEKSATLNRYVNQLKKLS